MTASQNDPEAIEPPLFATQGGGLATFQDGRWVWYSGIPDFLQEEGVCAGDPIPEDWGVAAVNAAASQESDDALMDDLSDEDLL